MFVTGSLDGHTDLEIIPSHNPPPISLLAPQEVDVTSPTSRNGNLHTPYTHPIQHPPLFAGDLLRAHRHSPVRHLPDQTEVLWGTEERRKGGVRQTVLYVCCDGRKEDGGNKKGEVLCGFRGSDTDKSVRLLIALRYEKLHGSLRQVLAGALRQEKEKME